MAEYLVKSETLTAVANAIREQTGKTGLLSLEAMVTEIKNIDFSKITPINIIPDTASSFTYDGTVKTPVWRNYDSEQLAISGTTSATSAGTYTVYFTPKAGYSWADESVDSKPVMWSIAKTAGSLSLSATSATIIGKNSTQTFTATRSGDGKISVSSSNTSIATVSLSGTTVTITSKGYGTATITVSVAAGTNYEAPSNKTYVVTVDYRYLYNNGTEYTSFTGALTAAARALDDYGSGRTKAPTITKGGSSLTVQQGSSSYGYNAGWAYWANPINLSNYTTLRISGSTGGGGSPKGVGIWNSTSGSIQGSSMVAYIDSFGSGTHTIDISGLSGNYYIGFYVYRKDRYVTCNYLRLE